ncbi:hypothetical protein WOLCODRAFT_155220 [Wolfiporia cocos MD-104 SS10]|uniref:Uncharacterized protein n=1 Tax=Wolfiporia cocos (strain MD-104) TaxID=742152 RepID=A0A2H3J744_WOLCO|nr:hypothetical protein WOLCODRAFT_155220 [Wolfiporia cocos MD-104 SS10]
MFNAVSGPILSTVDGHTHGMSSVAVSPDSQFAISGSSNGEINMWSTVSGALTERLLLPKDAVRIDKVTCIAYSLDGRTIVTGSWMNIKRTVAAPSEMGSVANTEQASAFMEAMLHIWDPDTGDCLQSAVVCEGDKTTLGPQS